MIILAKIIGVLFTVAGVVLLVHPETAKKLFSFWEEGQRIYGLAIIRFIVGAILLLAARECMMPVLVIVIGVLPIIGGLIIVVLGPEKARKIIEKWKKKPDLVFRKISLVPLVLGLLLLWAI